MRQHNPCSKFRKKVGALRWQEATVDGILLNARDGGRGNKERSSRFTISNGIAVMRSEAAQGAISNLDYCKPPSGSVTVMAIGQEERSSAQCRLDGFNFFRSSDSPIFVKTAKAVEHTDFRRAVPLNRQRERIVRIVAPEPKRPGIVKSVSKAPAYGRYSLGDCLFVQQNARPRVKHSHDADSYTFLRAIRPMKALSVDEQAGNIGLSRVSRQRRGQFFAWYVEGID